jgi:hypothetical protein
VTARLGRWRTRSAGVIEPSVGGDALAIERSWAVLLTIAFAVTALVAALAPSVR